MRAVTAVMVAAGVLFAGLSVAGPASALVTADDGARSSTVNGHTLKVSPAREVSRSGVTVTVSGKGYNPTIGIYVAWCVTPKKGFPPSPCGGGINTSGKGAGSVWVSSNPPPYGKALAVPFKKGGVFKVKLYVSPMIGDVDCRVTSCSVVTRADHTRTDDRSMDVTVRVTFDR